MTFVRGEGCWLTDDAGARWLDFSAGVVAYDKNRHASVADLVREADASMYEAKRGRAG